MRSHEVGLTPRQQPKVSEPRSNAIWPSEAEGRHAAGMAQYSGSSQILTAKVLSRPQGKSTARTFVNPRHKLEG